jgi:outer membrane immunogenic protein
MSAEIGFVDHENRGVACRSRAGMEPLLDRRSPNLIHFRRRRPAPDRSLKGAMMRKILFGTAGALAMAAGASAADLPIYTKAPPLMAAYNWTGFYVGGNIGYSWGRSETIVSLNDVGGKGFPSGVFAAATNFDLDGVIGGGQIGYNWQRGNWVFGIEADLQATGQSGRTNVLCTTSICNTKDSGPLVTDSLSQKLTWLETARGRLGVTVTPTLLGYVTGGLAVGGVSTSGTIAGTTLLGGVTPVIGSFSSSASHAGWTIGGGFETLLGGNWTGKIEYLYVDLGTVSGGPFATPIMVPCGVFMTSSFSSHVTDNILRAGLNYRF